MVRTEFKGSLDTVTSEAAPEVAPGFSAMPEGRAEMRLIYSMERVAAAAAVLLLFPFLAAIAIALAILSGRGPLVRHTRVGWRGRPLYMVKFRTMWPQALPSKGRWKIQDVAGYIPDSKQERDMRVISRFAAFCRRYSLDELPQLYHVVRGEMSLVGPRPITLAELEKFYPDCAGKVLAMRPGLTGLWQISGRNRLTYEQRKRLDLLLVQELRASLYCAILIRSIPRVLGGRDSY